MHCSLNGHWPSDCLHHTYVFISTQKSFKRWFLKTIHSHSQSNFWFTALIRRHFARLQHQQQHSVARISDWLTWLLPLFHVPFDMAKHVPSNLLLLLYSNYYYYRDMYQSVCTLSWPQPVCSTQTHMHWLDTANLVKINVKCWSECEWLVRLGCQWGPLLKVNNHDTAKWMERRAMVKQSHHRWHQRKHVWLAAQHDLMTARTRLTFIFSIHVSDSILLLSHKLKYANANGSICWLLAMYDKH